MHIKKTICKKCKARSAIFNPDTGEYKCHICGSSFPEYKTTITGTFHIEQGVDNRGLRYIRIKTDESFLKIERKGDIRIITITEDA